jgi:hypothetical protein
MAEIDIVEAYAETRQQAQTAAIKQPRHEGMLARHRGEPPLNLRLGGGRHLALSGMVGEKPFHILGPKPVRMGLAAEVLEIVKYPLARSLLGTIGVVVIAEHLTYLVHEPEAGIWAKFLCIFLLTFHGLWHNSAICGNQ